jgi:moderate conductance mechanosensitive channel
MGRASAKHKVNPQRRWASSAIGPWVGIFCLVFAFAVPNAWGQASPFPSVNLKPFEQSFEKLLTARDVEVDTSRVKLDGYSLFAIAAPAVKNDKSKSDNATPIDLRRQAIEQQLNRLAASGRLDPKSLAVLSTLDRNSGLPVISVNAQYLMTVTELDAQLQSSDPQRWATELSSIVRNALVRAHQERQTRFLIRQGVIASGSLLIMLILSRLLAYGQRHFKARRKQLDAQNAKDSADYLSQSGSENLPTPAPEITATQLARQQRRNLIDLKLRTLQIGQVGLWVCGTFAILGLFPQTRWLRPFLVSTPLQLLGIGLSIYVLIRLSDVLVDQFFKSIQTHEFIPPEASQRLVLRISTVARVVKSTASLFWVGAGGLSSLSLLGVDLLPLIAGAGILGLALSFAAQSVIKDVINGFLILFEDQYAVGDVITVGNVGGLVENINLRITQLRNSEGMLITIPNSQISTVQNLSQGWSRVDLTIQIGHSTDPDYALQVLKRLAEEMYRDRQWHSKLIEPPDILGIDAIDHAGIAIRIWIKTQPLQQWAVAREFRRRLKKAMDKESLSVGMPQQSLWFNGDSIVSKSSISSETSH